MVGSDENQVMYKSAAKTKKCREDPLMDFLLADLLNAPGFRLSGPRPGAYTSPVFTGGDGNKKRWERSVEVGSRTIGAYGEVSSVGKRESDKGGIRLGCLVVVVIMPPDGRLCVRIVCVRA